ncbi:MAG: hypothetical protein KUG69_11530 [Marinosulfonomonas sp.]|nr:hypothetical protein [Marinosulfonomonas sp.]
MTYADPRDPARDVYDDPKNVTEDENKADQPQSDEPEPDFKYTDWASI